MTRKIKIYLQLLSIGIPLTLCCGCAVKSYPTRDLSHISSLSHFDIKNPPSTRDTVVSTPDGNRVKLTTKFTYQDPNDQNIHLDLQYRKEFNDGQVNIPVSINNEKFLALLDTGYSGIGLISSDIVLQENLSIYPFGNHGHNVPQGFCHVPTFTVGTGRIYDATVKYTEQEFQARFLNVPIYRINKVILLGCGFMKTFKYVLFDNTRNIVTLSGNDVFAPKANENWMSYPMSIKLSKGSNRHIFVELPIGNQRLYVMFDSCGSAPGLDLCLRDWQLIRSHLEVEELKTSSVMNWQVGKYTCQEATISELLIGNVYHRDARVVISDREHSMVSLNYFNETQVVLDFTGNRFWIRDN